MSAHGLRDWRNDTPPCQTPSGRLRDVRNTATLLAALIATRPEADLSATDIMPGTQPRWTLEHSDSPDAELAKKGRLYERN
jgi:hypothetical protein